MPQLIQLQDVKDGDLLLYHGFTWIARAERYFDASDYNHTSLYLGNDEVIEAKIQGVIRNSVAESIRESEPVIVLRLINRPKDMQLVVSKAQEFEGDRYAYEQILMLALICTFRKMRVNIAVKWFVNAVLERAASLLLRLTQAGKEALICSELGYRSYNDAVPDDDNDEYTIHLKREHPDVAPEHSGGTRPYTCISENSLVSYFYGVNRPAPDAHAFVPTVLEKENMAATATLLETGVQHTDAEMETLFRNVVDSYAKEDYTFDREAAVQLKRSLDMFITASYIAKKKDKNITIPTNPDEVLTSFLEVNSKFVTNGDLFKAKNLQNIGRIK